MLSSLEVGFVDFLSVVCCSCVPLIVVLLLLILFNFLSVDLFAVVDLLPGS